MQTECIKCLYASWHTLYLTPPRCFKTKGKYSMYSLALDFISVTYCKGFKTGLFRAKTRLLIFLLSEIMFLSSAKIASLSLFAKKYNRCVAFYRHKCHFYPKQWSKSKVRVYDLSFQTYLSFYILAIESSPWKLWWKAWFFFMFWSSKVGLLGDIGLFE